MKDTTKQHLKEGWEAGGGWNTIFPGSAIIGWLIGFWMAYATGGGWGILWAAITAIFAMFTVHAMVAVGFYRGCIHGMDVNESIHDGTYNAYNDLVQTWSGCAHGVARKDVCPDCRDAIEKL